MTRPASFPGPAILDRRELLSRAVATPVVASTLVSETSMAAESQSDEIRIIDSNVSLFQWPFQRLPLDTVPELVSRLRSLNVIQAWAGTFEGLLHRDTTAVNDRLTTACHEYAELIPVGSINPVLPGWQSDLERCIQHRNMPGIRLHPNYHGYSLSDPLFADLLQRCAALDCFVQIAVAMEDNRTQSTLVRVNDVNLAPLRKVLQRIPGVRIQLLNARLRPSELQYIRHLPNVFLDVARVDGTDAIPRLLSSVEQHRVLFGSHAPFLIPEAAMIRVHESQQLDAATLSAVYRENAHHFAGASNV